MWKYEKDEPRLNIWTFCPGTMTVLSLIWKPYKVKSTTDIDTVPQLGRIQSHIYSFVLQILDKITLNPAIGYFMFPIIIAYFI